MSGIISVMLVKCWEFDSYTFGNVRFICSARNLKGKALKLRLTKGFRAFLIILKVMKPIFNAEQQKKAAFILGSPLTQLSELYSNEIKDLAIVWCYYSGKIEGNTYTYVETEALLKDGITSEKRYEDAKMLKNLCNPSLTGINGLPVW